MIKKLRHKAIISLIESVDVSTQEELTEKLIEQGFVVSQATISRDIKDLNLVKVEGANKKTKYVKVDLAQNKLSPQRISLFKQITLSIESANNLIVLKTISGNASVQPLVHHLYHNTLVDWYQINTMLDRMQKSQVGGISQTPTQTGRKSLSTCPDASSPFVPFVFLHHGFTFSPFVKTSTE